MDGQDTAGEDSPRGRGSTDSRGLADRVPLPDARPLQGGAGTHGGVGAGHEVALAGRREHGPEPRAARAQRQQHHPRGGDGPRRRRDRLPQRTRERQGLRRLAALPDPHGRATAGLGALHTHLAERAGEERLHERLLRRLADAQAPGLVPVYPAGRGDDLRRRGHLRPAHLQAGRAEQGVGGTLQGDGPPARHAHLLAHGLAGDTQGELPRRPARGRDGQGRGATAAHRRPILQDRIAPRARALQPQRRHRPRHRLHGPKDLAQGKHGQGAARRTSSSASTHRSSSGS